MNTTTFRHLVSAARGWLLCATAVLVGCGGGGGGDAPAAAEPVVRLEIGQTSVLLTAAHQERQLSARAIGSSGGTVDARVTWSSSAADQISVDAGGKLRSVTPIGSAMIFAEVDGVRSLPVFVSTVELKPGTTLLRDIDIVAVAPPPAPINGGIPGAGTQYDIWLAGQQAPSLGTILLATETINVSGKVVETAVEPNRVRVRLERLAMPDLLARYDVNWTIDLTAYDIVVDEATAALQGPAQKSSQRRLAAGSRTLPEWKIPKEGVKSPCSASVEAVLKAKPLQVKVAGSPKFEVLSSKLDATLPPGRLRVALVGDFYIETSVGLTAEAGLTGEVKCELKGHIPLPFLPVPLNLIFEVPVGLGIAASGKVEVASIDIGLSGKNGATFEMGIDCAPPRPCRGLDSASRINEITPHMQINAEAERMKIELEAGAYFLTGIDAVFGIGNASYEYNLLDVKIGPKQKADFGPVKRQLEDVPYASDYDLAFVLEIGPGKTIKDGIKALMGGEPGELSFGLPLSLPISESPRGPWRASLQRAQPNTDKVDFTIDLASTDYLGVGYNVESVSIRHRREGEPEYRTVATIPVSAPAQTRFQWRWQPTVQDAGKNQFTAFVKTKLPVVELEIAKNSTLEVEVACSSGGPAPGKGRGERLQAAGACSPVWAGTVTTRMVRNAPTHTLDATTTAEVTLEVDDSMPPPPLTVLHRLRSGSYRHESRLDQPNRNPPCRTLERTSGAMRPEPLNPLLAGSTTATIDLLLGEVGPSQYRGSGFTAVEMVQTSNCNDRNEDVTLTMPGITLAWWSMPALQPVSADGKTLQGSASAPDGLGGTITFTWLLTLQAQ